MKTLLLTLLFSATFWSPVLSLNLKPMDGIPYCQEMKNGYFFDGAGTRVIASVMCYGPALAIFHNGQDTGFNISVAMQATNSNGFWYYSGNATSYNPNLTGVLWDVGVETDCHRGGGYAISGGTLNTFDGALSIMIDEILVAAVGLSNTTCTATSVGISVPDLPSYALDKTFYFPQGPADAWARVVDTITNPTTEQLSFNVSYYNNLGSDEATHFFNVTERYSLSGDSNDTSTLFGNLVSIHWSSVSSPTPSKFVHFTMAFAPLTNGNDEVVPQWDSISLAPGQSVTFMLIANQGGYDMVKMRQSVLEIDSNPLKLYNEMTDEQLKTLHNFNPCAATGIPTVEALPEPTCNSEDKAEYNITGIIKYVPARITAVNSENAVVATSSGTTFAVPAGTFTVKFNFGKCAIDMGQIIVTCGVIPAAPASTPVSTPISAPAATPSKKTSAASVFSISFIASGVALILIA